jgi:hypothetical protein
VWREKVIALCAPGNPTGDGVMKEVRERNTVRGDRRKQTPLKMRERAGRGREEDQQRIKDRKRVRPGVSNLVCLILRCIIFKQRMWLFFKMLFKTTMKCLSLSLPSTMQ